MRQRQSTKSTLIPLFHSNSAYAELDIHRRKAYYMSSVFQISITERCGMSSDNEACKGTQKRYSAYWSTKIAFYLGQRLPRSLIQKRALISSGVSYVVRACWGAVIMIIGVVGESVHQRLLLIEKLLHSGEAQSTGGYWDTVLQVWRTCRNKACSSLLYIIIYITICIISNFTLDSSSIFCL